MEKTTSKKFVLSDPFTLTFKEFLYIVGFTLGSAGLAFTLRDAGAPPTWSYGSDVDVYLDLAQNIGTQHRYVHSPAIGFPGLGVHAYGTAPVPVVSLSPGYPFMLAGVIQLFHSVWAAYGLAYLLFLLLAVSVFQAEKLLFGDAALRRARWIVFSVFILLQPVLLLHLQAIGQDLAATAFTALLIVAWIQAMRVPSMRAAVALALAAFFCMAMRLNMVAFVLTLLTGGLIASRGRVGKVALVTVCLSLLGWALYVHQETRAWRLGLNDGFGIFTNYAYRQMPQQEFDRVVDEETRRFNALLHDAPDRPNAVGAQIAEDYRHRAMDYLRQDKKRAAKTIVRHVAVIFLARDYCWLPRLLFVKARTGQFSRYDDPFASLYPSAPLVCRLLYQALNMLCVGIYIGMPAAALAGTLLWSGYALFQGRPLSQPQVLLGLMSATAVLFVLVTSVFLAQPRYRIPTIPISCLCILGFWARLRRRSDSEDSLSSCSA